jgi:[ribosomal protein S5]-alanine N-acetyltransferase
MNPGRRGCGATLCGMRRVLERCELRPFLPEDAPAFAQHANDITVWRSLRDLFPHPYTLDHAVRFIEHTLSQSPACHRAIVIEGQAVGVIGLKLGTDVERISAELGYWLGAPHRGRGVMTEAIRAFTDEAFETFSLSRIFALPFAHNVASCRALEKAGFELEGVLRRSCIKEGRVMDQRQYARVRELES